MKTLTVTMPDSVAERVKVLCNKHGITVGEFMKRAMATQELILEQFPEGTKAPLEDPSAAAMFAEALRRLSTR
jgi:hypothetical protein